MDFDDAYKYDKRTFREYFVQKVIENQIFMDTFFNKEELKPLTIKLLILILEIELYFVVNGLFFTEDYISELYHSEEEEKFFSYIPRSIERFFFATIVSEIIGLIIDCIFIDENKIKRVFLREKENPSQVKYEISLIIKSIKKSIIIFIVICFVLSLFSWYYVCCFNNVYPSVEVEWVKSSITIVIVIQFISFLCVVIVSLIRLLAFLLKSEKIYNLKDFFV